MSDEKPTNPQPVLKGPPRRPFTRQELWATLSRVQRVAWLKRAGVLGDPQLDKAAGADWHRLDAKTAARLGAVR